jgi:hypothetical protein
MKPQEICAYTFSFSETVNLKAQIESAKTFLRIHSITLHQTVKNTYSKPLSREDSPGGQYFLKFKTFS